jgi:hypothetical protein
MARGELADTRAPARARVGPRRERRMGGRHGTCWACRSPGQKHGSRKQVACMAQHAHRWHRTCALLRAAASGELRPASRSASAPASGAASAGPRLAPSCSATWGGATGVCLRRGTGSKEGEERVGVGMRLRSTQVVTPAPALRAEEWMLKRPTPVARRALVQGGFGRRHRHARLRQAALRRRALRLWRARSKR